MGSPESLKRPAISQADQPPEFGFLAAAPKSSTTPMGDIAIPMVPTGKSSSKGLAKGKGKGSTFGAPMLGAPASPWSPGGKLASTGWSCRVQVGAEKMYHEFPVAQKILGDNEMNVDHIRKETGVTLQLRGHNSGFREPGTGEELAQPLQICLHCDTQAGYQNGLEMVQDLMKSIYE